MITDPREPTQADLSAEETATTMGISPSSVRSATHRALASLGRVLQEQS